MINLVLVECFFCQKFGDELANTLSSHQKSSTKPMVKYLLNPNVPDAMSPTTIHKVVLNGISFELPDAIWSIIDDAFGHYWNIEVGFGAPQTYFPQWSLSPHF